MAGLIMQLVLKAMGARMAGIAAREESKFEANSLRRDAKGVRAEARQHAELIRKMGESTGKQATAATAASGVDVNSGTSLEIQRNIATESEKDALNTILSGDYRAQSLEDQARLARRRGKNAERAAYMGAFGSGMSTVGSSISGWGGRGWG